MKMLLNRDYGGFCIKSDLMTFVKGDEDERFCDALIKMVEKGVDISEDGDNSIEVVNIPDNATDYYINEYDGFEEILYVVDGKIHEL